MSASDTPLDELERDALTELVNIAVSRAASSLRTMVGKLVGLDVPSIEILPRQEAARFVALENGDQLTGVGQHFDGGFSGRAMLILQEQSARHLSGMVLGNAGLVDDDGDLADEALAETGNVMLNACIGSIANMLKSSLQVGLPEMISGNASELFDVDANRPDSVVLFTYINFQVGFDAIRGYIALLIDLPSLKSLRYLLQEFIARALEETS